MPIPPPLVICWPIASIGKERNADSPDPPPNGPSVETPADISPSMLETKTLSKLCAVLAICAFEALAATTGAPGVGVMRLIGGVRAARAVITSPECRLAARPRP